MATFKPVVFKSQSDNHNKADGTTNIKIRVYHNGDSKYIPTRFFIASMYMSKTGEVLEECPEADNLNYELGDIIQSYRKIVLKIGSMKLRQMSCTALRNHLVKFTDPKTENINFVSFSRQIIAEPRKESTSNWYKDSLNALTWFYKSEIIDANDITSSLLNDLIKQLRKKGPGDKPLEPGSINNYLRGIRALFNKYKLEVNDDDLGIIRVHHDPFKKVKIPKYKRKRKNIGTEEIKKIRDSKCDQSRDILGKDVFMMLFYLMGMNIADLYKLEAPISGRVEYERKKMDREEEEDNILLSIKVELELQFLFDKYSSKGFLSDIKNRYATVQNLGKAVNTGLKNICEREEIKKVTTLWVRHSWASLARNKAGATTADVDFCLGHVTKEHKMADIYIEEDYSICDRINRDVINLLE
nr:phage integrase SAM-like domain-containing protein [uncultured Draconibacterium sp.]